MRERTRHDHVRGAATLFLCLALGCASLPGARSIEGEGWRHDYARAGETGPVVIFEAGLSDGMESWREVFIPVSSFARAFAYSRAGYGDSRSENEERDAATVVRELRRTLEALALEPPYVLVGHSLGGQFVEYFARAHSSEVKGLVLVDVRNVDYSRRCVEEGLERCELSTLTRLLAPDVLLKEADASRRTEASIPDVGAFPPVPVVVLSATQRPRSSDALKRTWAETQAELTRLSPKARQEICDTCGHYIQLEDPQRVIDAIRSVAVPAK